MTRRTFDAYERWGHYVRLRSESADGARACTQTLKHCPSLEKPLQEFARVLEPRGVLVFSVTHPKMDFSGYEMRETPRFILSEEADIFRHSVDDYRIALSAAGFTVDEFRAVYVSAAIASYLTDQSFQLLEGRPQVAVVRAHIQ